MILAIESSCDETALAIFDPAIGLTGEWVHSQIALHAAHGGVVPDLATREHLQTMGPLLATAGEHASWEQITRVAVTHGPGLAGCLAIGTAAAKSLALALGVPLSGVNHLRGHVYSPFISAHQNDPARFDAVFSKWLPHLALVVSGGNTLLAQVDVDRRIRVLSSTRDDAAGEALDKGAKLLGLGYPGGPLIEREAHNGNPAAYNFPRGIGRRDELDFSFSGLKTSLRYQLEKMTPDEVQSRRADLCASYQQAVIDALARKTGAALRLGKYRSLGLSGGVANNLALRAMLVELAKKREIPLLAAEPKHTGDNAGMIAFAAWVDPTVEPVALAELRIEPGLELA